jgi:hypothetical protein
MTLQYGWIKLANLFKGDDKPEEVKSATSKINTPTEEQNNFFYNLETPNASISIGFLLCYLCKKSIQC